jgi:Relaxase/Mobilisation nuclease domain
MIGKVVKGASFYGCLEYCLHDKRGLTEEQKVLLSVKDGLQHQGRAEVLDYNLCFGDLQELAEQFRDVQKLSRNAKKPVLHLTLRAAPGDQLTRAQWIEIGRAAAQEFGIDKNQYITILHKDTPEPHIHIVANRVGFDGKVVSDSNSYARMAALSRRLEKKYHLTEVLSPRRFLSQKERLLPRQDQRKLRLKEKIAGALKGTTGFAEFEKKITAAGYRVDKGRGIAFEDDKKVRVKGSEVGYSLATIERILAQNRLALFRESIAQQSRKPTQQDPQQPKNELGKRKPTIKRQSSPQPTSQEPPSGLGKLIDMLLAPVPPDGSGLSSYEQEELRRRRKKKRPRP